MSKSRWHMVLKGLLFGSENQDEVIRLGETYQNWTPLEIYIYQIGVFGGFIGGFISALVFVIIFLGFQGRL